MRQLTISGIVLTLMFAFGIAEEQTSIYKELTLTQAVAEAQTGQRMVMVHFYATWCGYCKAMDKDTFNDATVRTVLNKKYIPIQIDVESPVGLELTKKYQIHGTPVIAIFDETGKMISARPGYQDPQTFLRYLTELNAVVEKF
ncbi:MAG TPA: hypothetical protein DHU63_08765 [Candidatus Marinimicrobia bacterium]|nr:MAG: hypothetical protein AUJ47_08955 [Candidatus Marinimicrobia bacterium CG1_02_48_14]HCW76616.1 hypothetical protein [Candidatus Neomarinimicrobiota bacterium]